MKPHVVVKLRRSVRAAPSFWGDIIRDKSRAVTSLEPSVDHLLAKHSLPVWIAREYRPSGAAGDAGHARWSDAEVASGLDRIYRVILQRDGKIPPDLVEQIRLLPQVEYVRVGVFGESDLPRPQPVALGVRRDDAARRQIHLDEAHERYTRGHPSVTIGVLDTGVHVSHPELRRAMEPGFDFVDILDGAGKFIGDYLDADEDAADEVGHGTHVAGVIAARGTNMPPGVAPNCRVIPCRVLAAMERDGRRIGAGLVDNISSGIKWLVDQGADVINASLGIRHEGGGLPHEEVIDYARRRGVTVVAASGNDGSEQLYYPGALPHVIAVGATETAGGAERVAAFSTYGQQVSLVAPGTDIYSTYVSDGYAFSTGTSHAAPFISGAVALLKSYAREHGVRLGDAQVKHLLKHTADKPGRRFKDRKAGFGRLNLVDALRLLQYRLN